MTSTVRRYERLLDDLGSDLRPQREWVEGRGLFLVTGHFVVGVAAGTWLFGLIFGVLDALVGAFALAALGGLAHLAFLGRPGRAWKMMLHARTSWISRGFFGLSLFLAGGVLYLPPLVIPAVPWSAGSAIADAGYLLALAGMAVLIVYMGFVYAASKAIPYWTSPLHPVLYMAYACRGGVAALLLALAARGRPLDPAMGLLELWMAITAVVVGLWLFDLQSSLSSGNEAARRSVRELLAGRVAVYFYGGILVVGLAVPAVLITGAAGPVSTATMAAIGLASVIGDFFIKYATIKAGVYQPIRLHDARARRA